MAEEIIIRGNLTTAEGYTSAGVPPKKIRFGGLEPGTAYNLIEFQLYPSTSLGSGNAEMSGVITCGKVKVDAANIDFNNEAIIGTAYFSVNGSIPGTPINYSVINDLFPITQDLTLNTFDAGTSNPVNWQCRFRKVKLSQGAEAVANFNQFSILDG